MTRRALYLSAVASLMTTGAQAGGYTFAEGESFGEQRPDLVVHPAGYSVSAPILTDDFDVRVCILPGSPFANDMVTPLRNIIDRYNLLVPVRSNLRITDATANFDFVDWESVALHEVGHCLGLNHPNAASEGVAEFGISTVETEATKANPGGNAALDPNDGGDGLHGSPDDPRGDDQNLHWFEIGVNNPLIVPGVVDALTYSRDLADLPGGDNFAANAERNVAFTVFGAGDDDCTGSFFLGARCAEAVMQQGTFNAELQRALGPDDVATLRFARSGVDREAGSNDDYVPTLVYGGISNASSCDISVAFDNSETEFAVCFSGAPITNLNEQQNALALDSYNPNDADPVGRALFNANANWRFSQTRIPLPAPDQASVNPGSSVGLVNGAQSSLLANDRNQRLNRLNASLTMSTIPALAPIAGDLSLNSNGTFTYTNTDAGATSDRFIYEVCDRNDEEACAHQYVDIVIAATNQQPEPVADMITVAEGAAATMTASGDSLLDNDADPDNDNLTTTTAPLTAPLNGNLILQSNGAFSYSHDGGETTSDGFVYEVCDDGSPQLCASAMVTIVITEVNDPVSAADDTLPATNQGAGDRVITFDEVLGNDSAGSGEDETQTLAVTAVSSPTGGTATIDAESIVFSPDPDFSGTVGFDYAATDDGTTNSVSDPQSDTARASYFINDRPVVMDDAVMTTVGNPVSIAVLANDADDDGLNPTSVEVASEPIGGSVAIMGESGAVDYAPAAGFNGVDVFTYTVEDLFGARSLPATVTVTVSAIPVAMDDAFVVASGRVSRLEILANDEDADGDLDPQSVQIEAEPDSGTAAVQMDGSIDYTPAAGAAGNDSLTYSVADATGLRSAAATVAIQVNDAPEALDDAVFINQGTAVDIDALGNDSDPQDDLDRDSLQIVGGPANGSAEVVDGMIRYTPDASFFGIDALTYTVADGLGAVSDPATVTLNVNALPVARSDSAMTRPRIAVLIDVLDNDNDPDGQLDRASLTIATTPTDGVAEVDAGTARIRYTPAPGFIGDDAFSYRVADEAGALSEPASVTITVLGAPAALDDAAVTDPATPIDIDVLANDFDDGMIDAGSVALVDLPASGMAVVDARGHVLYSPDPGFEGLDTFSYTVMDDEGLTSNVAVVVVAVGQAPPEAREDTLALGPGGRVTRSVDGAISLLANDRDLNGDTLRLNVDPLIAPAAGQVTLNPDGTFAYFHTDLQVTSDSFRYEVCDATDRCASGRVMIRILAQTVFANGYEEP